jgi:hypothetical protein
LEKFNGQPEGSKIGYVELDREVRVVEGGYIPDGVEDFWREWMKAYIRGR